MAVERRKTRQLMGSSRIQNEGSRLTFPEAVREVGFFRGDGSKELAFWGYHEDEGEILFANGQALREMPGVRYLGTSTVGSNRLLPIPKKCFPDYVPTQVPSPVEMSDRLEYGQQVFLVLTDVLPGNVFVGRLLEIDEVDPDFFLSAVK